jgi:HTH-type transcriptional regulator / antitoxin HigA
MTITAEKLTTAWSDFQKQVGGIRLPKNEKDYDHLHELLQGLTDNYNCNKEPHASLFDLIARYMHEYELDHYPELKIDHLEPFERLKFLMERRGVSQYQLAKEGIMSQGNLSNILSGKKGISKDLAKKLAKYFGISVETFI